MSTGDRIRRLRKEKGWKQTDLGKRVNVSSQVISNWERGYTDLSHSDIISLAEALDTSTDYLLEKTDNPDKMGEEEFRKMLDDPMTNIMFDDWINMTKEQRKEALNFIKFLREQEKKDER